MSRHLKPARVVLGIGAAVFVVVGVGFILIPVQWAAVVDIQLPTAMARTDLRATYGGFNLGVGVFLAACASRGEWVRPGIAAFGLAAAGYGTGRLIGILVERTATPLMAGFVILELTTATVALYLFRRLSTSAVAR